MKNLIKIECGDDQVISFDNIKSAKKYFRTLIRKYKKLNKTHPTKREIVMYSNNCIIDYWRIN